MAGTKEGGRKAAITNKERHGASFYRDVGRKGGSTSYGRTRGFAHPSHAHKASEAGRKGGSVRGRQRHLHKLRSDIALHRPRDEHGRFLPGGMVIESIVPLATFTPVRRSIPNLYYALWIVISTVAIVIAYLLGIITVSL